MLAVVSRSPNCKDLRLSTVNLWCSFWNGSGLLEAFVWFLCPHATEEVLRLELQIQNPATLHEVDGGALIDTLLRGARPLYCLLLLGIDSQGVDDAVSYILFVAFIDLCMSDNSKDCILQVGGLLLLSGPNDWYQGRVVLPKVSGKGALEGNLDFFLGHPQILVQQAEDLIKTDLIPTCVFYNFIAVWKLCVESVRGYTDHAYKRDMLEPIF